VKVTAKQRWTRLDSDRSAVLDRARACAELTIPAELPRAGSNQTNRLPTPYQSLGARGVNNLSSKMLLALLPPSAAFFRLRIADEVAEALGTGKSKIEEGLRKIENRTMQRVETGNLRPTLFAALKHLVVTGNGLILLPADKPSRMYKLDQYVVVRDPNGTIIETITREEADPSTLPDDVIVACKVVNKPGDKRTIEIFTRAILKKDKVEWWQEINDLRVPGSFGRVDADESPFIVMRWQAVSGEDYGRGPVEEYLGDLRSLEGLSKAVIQFSAAAAKIIFLHHPNSSTDEDALIAAESGEIVTGRKDDIDVLQFEKFADFQVAKTVIDDLTLRLSHAFLLQSGTVRNAERVTAEEIRAMAQELEDVLGGVYTAQSQEFQLPLVRRLMAILREEGALPKMPRVRGRPAVEPSIVTGFDALGRGHELNRLRSYYNDLVGFVGPEQAQAMFSPTRLAEALGVYHNVDISELLKTEEETAADKQGQMQQVMLEKGTAPMAGALAKGMMPNG
jgi:hypothetical protein